MSPLAVPGILLLLWIVYVVLKSMRAGPIQLDPTTLSDGRSLRLVRKPAPRAAA